MNTPTHFPVLLALDTCGSVGGVALAADGRTLYRELTGRTFSELLLSTVSELLAEAGLTAAELDGVVVVRGPGSFTGIRIGVSAAKGLAEALGIPLIAISRLELLARKAPGGSAFAVLDAGRGEFYGGLYREGICAAELLLTRPELALAAAGLPLVLCEEGQFAALPDLNPELAGAPTALDAMVAGLERFRQGAFDDAATLDANYLRRSESEMLARVAEHAALRAARG